MDRASEDYFNSRNNADETNRLGKGVTWEKAQQAKEKMKKIAQNVKNRTEEDVLSAKQWWESHK